MENLNISSYSRDLILPFPNSMNIPNLILSQSLMNLTQRCCRSRSYSTATIASKRDTIARLKHST